MKITAALLPPVAREHAKPLANAAEQQGQKTTPPGLAAVQARLQAIPEAERNTGQTNALERINHNIARYLENQSADSITADTETSLNVTG